MSNSSLDAPQNQVSRRQFIPAKYGIEVEAELERIERTSGAKVFLPVNYQKSIDTIDLTVAGLSDQVDDALALIDEVLDRWVGTSSDLC